MIKNFKQAFKSNLDFYRKKDMYEFFNLAFLHIFIAWNGIQFILYPSHFNIIVDFFSLLQNFQTVQDIQKDYIAWFLFIIGSFVLFYMGLKYFFEIIFYDKIRKDDNQIKNKYTFFQNLIIPSFFHNLGVLFILFTVCLLFLLLYFLLTVIGIQIEIDFVEILKYMIFFFLLSLVFFNSLVIDFVLPEMAKGHSFSISLKKFYHLFLDKKLKVVHFYLVKILFMIVNVIVFYLFLKFLFSEPVIVLPINVSVLNIFIVFIGFMISVVLNAVFVMFFNVYSFFLKDEIIENPPPSPNISQSEISTTEDEQLVGN